MNMEIFLIIIIVAIVVSGVLGCILGYRLATHIHAIAQAAADRISHIGMVGETLAPSAPLPPTTPVK